jgi:hypothetical protein
MTRLLVGWTGTSPVPAAMTHTEMPLPQGDSGIAWGTRMIAPANASARGHRTSLFGVSRSAKTTARLKYAARRIPADGTDRSLSSSPFAGPCCISA